MKVHIVIDSRDLESLCNLHYRLCIKFGLMCYGCKSKYFTQLASAWLETWGFIDSFTASDLDLATLAKLSDMVTTVVSLAMNGKYIYVFNMPEAAVEKLVSSVT